jgi:hypothetical protein
LTLAIFDKTRIQSVHNSKGRKRLRPKHPGANRVLGRHFKASTTMAAVTRAMAMARSAQP